MSSHLFIQIIFQFERFFNDFFIYFRDFKMGLTKMQKGALLFGVLLMWSDQGSDISLGLDYYTNCHSNWALISFIF